VFLAVPLFSSEIPLPHKISPPPCFFRVEMLLRLWFGPSCSQLLPLVQSPSLPTPSSANDDGSLNEYGPLPATLAQFFPSLPQVAHGRRFRKCNLFNIPICTSGFFSPRGDLPSPYTSTPSGWNSAWLFAKSKFWLVVVTLHLLNAPPQTSWC